MIRLPRSWETFFSPHPISWDPNVYSYEPLYRTTRIHSWILARWVGVRDHIKKNPPKLSTAYTELTNRYDDYFQSFSGGNSIFRNNSSDFFSHQHPRKQQIVCLSFSHWHILWSLPMELSIVSDACNEASVPRRSLARGGYKRKRALTSIEGNWSKLSLELSIQSPFEKIRNVVASGG